MHIDYGIHLAAGVFILFAVKRKKEKGEVVLITLDEVGSGWSAIWSSIPSSKGLYFPLLSQESNNSKQTKSSSLISLLSAAEYWFSVQTRQPQLNVYFYAAHKTSEVEKL